MVPQVAADIITNASEGNLYETVGETLQRPAKQFGTQNMKHFCLRIARWWNPINLPGIATPVQILDFIELGNNLVDLNNEEIVSECAEFHGILRHEFGRICFAYDLKEKDIQEILTYANTHFRPKITCG